jgi:DNA-binding CsgD family transcriptional regulator/tetratricopeptide (TPR) repeat protein
MAQSLNRFEQSRRHHEQALRLWRNGSDPRSHAVALIELGWHSFMAADLDTARHYARKSLIIARQAGEMHTLGAALNLLALTSVEAGIVDGIAAALDESLSIWRRLGVLSEVVVALVVYARLEQQQDNIDHACSLLLEALHTQIRLDSTSDGFIGCLAVMFHFARDTCWPPQKYPYLARVCGALEMLDEKIGRGHTPWIEQKAFPLYKELRVQLGDEGFAREWAAGHELSVSGILALAEEIVQTVRKQATATAGARNPLSAYPAGLTYREVEVLRLIADGLTNAQAAAKLSVTSRTINSHLTSVYSKIGITSRAAAVRFAADHGLI